MALERVSKDCRVTFDMEPSLYSDLLEYQADNNNIALSRIVREALRKYLPKAKKKEKAQS